MNIAFYITPKVDIVTLQHDMTIRQALEKMEYHKYTAVPVIDNLGRYVYTLSEGDILWHLKQKKNLVLKATEKEKIAEIRRHRETRSASINSSMESLIEVSASQSFIPVVDDQNILSGIIKRSDIINYCMKQMKIKKETTEKERSA